MIWLMLHAQMNSLKKLTFRSKVCAADTKIFAKVVEKMNERAAADGQKNRIIHSQIRNKFKKLVCECKSISLSQRIASGINGKQWDIFFSFPLVASSESANNPYIVESSLCNDSQYTDTENNLGGTKNATTDKKGERNPKQKTKLLRSVY